MSATWAGTLFPHPGAEYRLYCTVLYLVESIDSAPPLVELGEDHPVEAEHHSDGQENGDGGGQLHLLQQQQTVKMKLLYII